MSVVEIYSRFLLLKPIKVTYFEPEIVNGHVLNTCAIAVLIKDVIHDLPTKIQQDLVKDL